MELAGKHVMVIGLGVSGLAAARFVAARGATLVMTDTRSELARGAHADHGAAPAAIPAGELCLGGENPAWLAGVDLVVASPGVAPASVLMRAAAGAGIPIIGELELAARFLSAPLVAITGTNGKSTVTVMVGEILKAAGMKTFAGGNLGTPLIEAAGHDYDVVVAEVSSYQLETIVAFHPRVAVHLNLTDDHLDRYRGLADYGRAKARIFMNQDSGDWAILNRDDARVWKLAPELHARVIGFGHAPTDERPALWPQSDAIIFDGGRGRKCTIELARFRLRGRHNIANAMAAAGAALALGVEANAIERALGDFRGLPHRLEFVCEKNGVGFIDDSKGTNVGAVVEALAAVTGPVILLAGGVDKGGDYAPMRAALKGRVKLLVLYGAARDKMRAALAGATAVAMAPTLAAAVKIAASSARRGDTVMLSPACSSFDQFRDYAERGRIYQELVRAL
ncbi:MAG: UDP-N-acetylmuramoyl-L-alanine--D-glutamate ligase [Candidatus Binataceae bacterium]